MTSFISCFKLSSGLIQEQRYRIFYNCSFQDGNLLFTLRYITRGDFLEARAETNCCKIIIICVVFDRLWINILLWSHIQTVMSHIKIIRFIIYRSLSLSVDFVGRWCVREGCWQNIWTFHLMLCSHDSLPQDDLFDSCYWKTLQTESYLSLLLHYLAVEIDVLFKFH
jgi:hypothetical protein